MAPPKTVPPPKAFRFTLAAFGVPPSPIFPNKLEPNPVLGAGEVAAGVALLAGV